MVMADYRNIISFIKSKEGGLSSATTDTASRNPSPCGNGSNGQPYHTNKGVTWSTFSSNASSLGYSASCSNFLNMPSLDQLALISFEQCHCIVYSRPRSA